LALETPTGNLVTGMQWLQATYANRFNRLRREHGHVFQGRYKALLVEEGGALGQVCDYLHLNPARAGRGSSGAVGGLSPFELLVPWTACGAPEFLKLDGLWRKPAVAGHAGGMAQLR